MTIRTDVLFRSKILWGWVIGTYKDSFLQTLYLIYKEINWNANKVNVIGITENYSLELIYNVINAYGNVLLADKKIKEYDGYNEKNNIDLIDTVSIYAGVNKELTTKVLKQLFWSTEQGRIDNTAWIKPRTYMQTSGYRELREDAVGSNWFKNLMYVLVIIGVSIAGYYVLKSYSTYIIASNVGKKRLVAR